MTKEIQPIYILPEGTQRSSGRNAQRTNIMAAKLVAETVRTTLGPKGMDKMLVDSLGDVTVTNDGVTILEEMQIEHPSAKMIVEVAKTQENEVGDGTTTAVVIAGELLKKAELLLEQEIHPTVIAKGYQMASAKSQEFLNAMAESVSSDDITTLRNIALTAMTGKGAEVAKEHLSKLTVEAVTKIMENGKADKENIKIEKKVGGGVEDTELVQGIIVDKEIVHSSMPRKMANAKIALLDTAVEIKNTEIDAKIQITDPAQMQAFLSQEEKMIKGMVDKVVASGATVLFCQKGIDDIAQHFFAKKGILACRRIKKSDMEKLARATGGIVLSNFDDLTEKELGNAGLVEEKYVGDEKMTYVQECLNPKSVTILVRGGTEHVVDEIKRALEDAIGDLCATLSSGKFVAGAGAPEVSLSKKLLEYANTLSGREQLAVRSFAEALEVIPRTLAENAGLDPIDVMTELKSSHQTSKWAGIDVFTGKVIDALSEGIVEPLKIKTQAVQSASEVAVMILRIDDIIAGENKGSEMPQMPPGGMPHM